MKWRVIKNRAFLIREGFLIKGRVKLLTNGKGRDESGSVWDIFIKVNVSGKQIKVGTKIYDEITKILMSPGFS